MKRKNIQLNSKGIVRGEGGGRRQRDRQIRIGNTKSKHKVVEARTFD